VETGTQSEDDELSQSVIPGNTLYYLVLPRVLSSNIRYYFVLQNNSGYYKKYYLALPVIILYCKVISGITTTALAGLTEVRFSHLRKTQLIKRSP
jgi:hypothetical protein